MFFVSLSLSPIRWQEHCAWWPEQHSKKITGKILQTKSLHELVNCNNKKNKRNNKNILIDNILYRPYFSASQIIYSLILTFVAFFFQRVPKKELPSDISKMTEKIFDPVAISGYCKGMQYKYKCYQIKLPSHKKGCICMTFDNQSSRILIELDKFYAETHIYEQII